MADFDNLDGEDITLSHGARLISHQELGEDQRLSRLPGSLRGQIWIADDFDETSEDLIAAFYGES
jgi:hypothetical protein